MASGILVFGLAILLLIAGVTTLFIVLGKRRNKGGQPPYGHAQQWGGQAPPQWQQYPQQWGQMPQPPQQQWGQSPQQGQQPPQQQPPQQGYGQYPPQQ